MKAVEVQRNESGMWEHPNLPVWGEDATTSDVENWFHQHGLTHHLVIMDGELGEGWARGELTSCNDWKPETDVKDSFLVGIWDTEDGVVAMFASPIDVDAAKQAQVDA